jgi:hypothetical protein
MNETRPKSKKAMARAASGSTISAPSFGMKSPGTSIGDSTPSISQVTGVFSTANPAEELATPTSQAFDDLRTMLDATAMYVSQLERRLKPVSSQRDCGEGKMESYPSRGSSPIVTHIESLANYVQNLNCQLSSIITDLEI